MSEIMMGYEYNKVKKETDKDDSEKIFFIFFSEVERYIEWLQTHGRRPKTITSVRRSLTALSPRVFEVLGDYTFEDIGPDQLQKLLDTLGDLTESSRRAYLGEFGRLIQFKTGVNPMKNAGFFWNDTQAVRAIFIKEDEWPKIKNAAKSTTDQLILGFGAYMGLRREEMVRIQMSDILDRTLIIHGKGHGASGKVIAKEIPGPVYIILQKYLKERAKTGTTSQQLFVRIDGRYPGKEMNGEAIKYACKQMMNRSGVAFTPHSLRRLYATTMYEATGHDIVQTKIATRHASADVLMNCYINANPSRQSEAIDRMLQMI